MNTLLAGTTILELGQVIAGNYAGILLADMGAEVIKVEPFKGDAARNAAIAAYKDQSSIHLTMNRGKKSVALDLKQPEGRGLFHDLVRTADVVIDNFRPGVLERLGVDHASLSEINPRIISCSVTGFGQYGAAMNRPAFDLVIQALSGHLHITGYPDGPPARVGIPLADIAGGLFCCISVLGALVGRERSGVGTRIDVAMLDSLVSLLSYDALLHLNTGIDIGRQGTAHVHMVPWQAFEVKDGYVVVAAREEKFWGRLCDAIGRPDLKDDERTATNLARVANRAFTVAQLEEAFASRTKAEWVEIFDHYDIPAAPVNDFSEVFADPQVQSRGLVRTYEHSTLGPVRHTVSPMQVEGWEFPNRPAPELGQHTREVLADRLGLTREQIEDLEARGLVKSW
jgi:crotonobetainyl-CoA:carnitine CoA-transferase CaiB-like acyl-CoA transferase